MKTSIVTTVKSRLHESAQVKMLTAEKTAENITIGIKKIIQAYKKKRKILLCGNGGSAADSQHIAAELVGRFRRERAALPAIALTTDSSIITAVSNDYCFDRIFSRQIEALGNKGDVLILISTSGNSGNLISASKMAKKKGLFTIGLLGKNGGMLKDLVDLAIIVPGRTSDIIQEAQITVGHIFCELVEQELFKTSKKVY